MVIFLDSGSPHSILEWHSQVAGITTNPSLLKKQGITNYRAFAQDVLQIVEGKPVSFEVFADDIDEMQRQAKIISSWGDNVYVKIPVMTTRKLTTGPLVSVLSSQGIKVNVTAIMTLDQVRYMARYISPQTPAILSIFAGRMADTGVDPTWLITDAIRVKHDKTKVLWASTREVFNIKQARESRCDIITLPPEILQKQHLIGKDLEQYSLETVKQFHEDGKGIEL